MTRRIFIVLVAVLALGIGFQPFGGITNAADPPESGALRVSWFDAIGIQSSLDTIDWSTPTRQTRTGRIEWDATGAPWEPDAVADEFAMRITGAIRAHAPGEYRFRLDSDEGSRLNIGAQTVIDHDGLHAMSTAEGAITLEPGYHSFTLEYFEQTGEAGLILQWIPPGASEWSVIPETSFADTEARIRTEWYFVDHGISRFDQVDWENPSLVTWESQINWPNGSGGFIPECPDNRFALRARTRLLIPEDGVYRFALGSDDGSRLVIDGEIIIDRNQTQGFSTATADVFLEAGAADIEVLYFENSGSEGLVLSWRAPSDAGVTVVPEDAFESSVGSPRPRLMRWRAQARIERERDPEN
ncbi:MAG: PA14 domain-containing protein [Phycisphaerales bacterium JB050]